MPADEFTIERIETWACRLPLAQPLDFGRFVVRERHHTVMRLHTRDGRTGECLTQSRGSPLDVVAAEVIAPRILGQSAQDIDALQRQVRDSLAAIEFDGAVGRAWSLAEICLQDLRAKHADQPLWRLLGAQRSAATVLLVEGYALVGENDREFVDRLVRRVHEGYRLIKIEAAHYADLDQLMRRLRMFRAAAGSSARLILDFAWSWSEAARYANTLKQFLEFGVEWVEDPFSRDRVGDYALLRAGGGVSLGCGDETTRPADLAALLSADAIDVARIDATTIGGITAVRPLLSACLARGVRASFHEHPEVHEHCVFGFGGVDHVEVFPADRPFDRVHELLESSPARRMREGMLHAQEEPGIGIRIRDDALKQWAWRHTVVDQRARAT